MRTLIALAVAASAFAGFSAPASANDTNIGSSVECLSGTNVGAWNVKWARGGNGRCPGQVLASDVAKVANLAANGATVLRVAFYIPEKCDSDWATMPVKVKGNTITLEPWNKMCREGYRAPQVVK